MTDAARRVCPQCRQAVERHCASRYCPWYECKGCKLRGGRWSKVINAYAWRHYGVDQMPTEPA